MPQKIPLFPDFRKISLDDKTLFTDKLVEISPNISEFTFTNFYIWRDCDRSLITMINDNICIAAHPENESSYFFEPIGKNNINETINTCLAYIPRLSRISGEFVRKYLEGKNVYKIDIDRENSDYLYLKDDLAQLKGKKFDGKRNRIKKFLKTSGANYRELTENDIPGCINLVEKWKLERKGGVCFDGPIKEALSNFAKLGLTGAVVTVNGQIEAFTIGEKLNNDTAIVYIELADQKMEGLAQYINQQFCINEWQSIKFINREQDLGDAGLRKAKLSYHPIKLIEKFNVTLAS